jgi:hypothetical protein
MIRKNQVALETRNTAERQVLDVLPRTTNGFIVAFGYAASRTATRRVTDQGRIPKPQVNLTA